MAKNTEDGVKIVVSITPEQSQVLRESYAKAIMADGAPGRMGPGTVLSDIVRGILDETHTVTMGAEILDAYRASKANQG